MFKSFVDIRQWVQQSVLAMDIIKRNETPAKATNPSDAYWNRYTAGIFERYPSVQTVEIVRSGLKSDSSLPRGAKRAPAGHYVVIASTGGKWGKSRQDFPPAA